MHTHIEREIRLIKLHRWGNSESDALGILSLLHCLGLVTSTKVSSHARKIHYTKSVNLACPLLEKFPSKSQPRETGAIQPLFFLHIPGPRLVTLHFVTSLCMDNLCRSAKQSKAETRPSAQLRFLLATALLNDQMAGFRLWLLTEEHL